MTPGFNNLVLVFCCILASISRFFFQRQFIYKRYSQLSNKRGVSLIEFEKKIHPPRTFPPSTFIDFLDFFHYPLHAYCIYVLVFFPKNPTLHVYFNLNVYWFCNICTPFTIIRTSLAIIEMRVIALRKSLKLLLQISQRFHFYAIKKQ